MNAFPGRVSTRVSTIQIQPVQNMKYYREQDREVLARGLQIKFLYGIFYELASDLQYQGIPVFISVEIRRGGELRYLLESFFQLGKAFSGGGARKRSLLMKFSPSLSEWHI